MGGWAGQIREVEVLSEVVEEVAASPLCSRGRVLSRALSSCFATRSTAAQFELAELAEVQLFHLLAVPGGVSALPWERRRAGKGTERRCETQASEVAAALQPGH